ncbi:phage portal protein [Winkia sp. UMB6473-AN360BR]|nr:MULTISPECIES: phage portal protein [Winkia]PLB81465.1 phage portal protein [Actinomyces sp. UMB0138]PMC93117.1 phage portal protein [Actinomyces sp. UMB0918]DAZ21571.1 MAG TPA: portal protein [Caudoviricetes sp.]MBS5947747.1 phage portal protein [Winkia neuii]MDK7229706.1 phage portal protein [Winkia sp. UMB1185]
MSITRAISQWLKGPTATRQAAGGAGISIPPALRRSENASLSVSAACGLSGVYRAIQIIATSVAQLPLQVERSGTTVTEGVPPYVRRPNLHQSRSDFLEALALSLASGGNAYIMATGQGRDMLLEALNPAEATPIVDPKTGAKTVSYRGRTYGADRIQHLALMPLPGSLFGLGPIQAARVELAGALDMRDYAAKYFRDSGQPAGILTTDQDATQDQLKAMRNAWNYRDADGVPLPVEDNPARVRVLSKGMHYTPLFINPRDAQWIEGRKMSAVDISRLFGIPASLMLAAVEGGSKTYSNLEQEWLSFIRFTLMTYTRKIEEALTALAPNGQTIRFNFEAFLRPDTLTRYQAHEIALRNGFLTPNEVRKIEGLNPLEEDQTNAEH